MGRRKGSKNKVKKIIQIKPSADWNNFLKYFLMGSLIAFTWLLIGVLIGMHLGFMRTIQFFI